MSTHLSIVIPAYNEEHNVRSGALSSVYNYLKDMDYTWEVIVANDGSSDSTAKLVKKILPKYPGFRFLDKPHRGKGWIVIDGMLAAKGDYILFTDMDQSTPLNQIEKFFPKFESGYDIVIGSRSGREGAPLIRQAMAVGWVVLRTLILRLPYRDTQCGFKAFTRDAKDKVFGKLKNVFDQRAVVGASTSAGFDVEMLYLARKMKLRVAEVPVKWHYKEGAGNKSLISESWTGFKGVISVRIKSILGKYR